MSAGGGSYNESEAQEIIRRAAAVQGQGFMSRNELIRAASELGISPEAVEEAEKDYQLSKQEEELKIRFRAKRRHEFHESFKMLLGCAVISYLLWPKNHPGAISWFSVVIACFGVWSVIMNGYNAYFERSPTWHKGFEDFKASEKKRKGLADQRANDKAIADILQSTSPRQKLEVVKTLRDTTGLPLNEAKSAVDDYYKRHPEIKSQGF